MWLYISQVLPYKFSQGKLQFPHKLLTYCDQSNFDIQIPTSNQASLWFVSSIFSGTKQRRWMERQRDRERRWFFLLLILSQESLSSWFISTGFSFPFLFLQFSGYPNRDITERKLKFKQAHNLFRKRVRAPEFQALRGDSVTN